MEGTVPLKSRRLKRCSSATIAPSRYASQYAKDEPSTPCSPVRAATIRPARGMAGRRMRRRFRRVTRGVACVRRNLAWRGTAKAAPRHNGQAYCEPALALLAAFAAAL